VNGAILKFPNPKAQKIRLRFPHLARLISSSSKVPNAVPNPIRRRGSLPHPKQSQVSNHTSQPQNTISALASAATSAATMPPNRPPTPLASSLSSSAHRSAGTPSIHAVSHGRRPQRRDGVALLTLSIHSAAGQTPPILYRSMVVA
jgi:hypothetical protein